MNKPFILSFGMFLISLVTYSNYVGDSHVPFMGCVVSLLLSTYLYDSVKKVDNEQD